MTITGSRSIERHSAIGLPQTFEEYLRPFAVPDAHFYLGGAAGIDTIALEWLAEHTHATVTVVVPCTLPDQPAIAVEAITQWRDRGRIHGVVELGASELSRAAYHARNRWMVDRSAFVIGFPRGTEAASGTWYTLNYAAGQSKPRLVVPV